MQIDVQFMELQGPISDDRIKEIIDHAVSIVHQPLFSKRKGSSIGSHQDKLWILQKKH